MAIRKEIIDKIKQPSKSTEVKTRYRYNQPNPPSTETEETSTASVDNTRPGMRKTNMNSSSETSSTASTPSTSSKSEYGTKTTSGFGKAFSEARKAGNKDFDYQGKKYAAVTKEEVDKSGAKNLTEYLNKNKSTAIVNKGKTEPDDYSQLDSSVQRTSTSQGKTEPDDYSQLDSSVQKTSTADASDIFSGVKKFLGLKKGGDAYDSSMDRARGVTPEQYAEERKTPHAKNKYKDGGDIHVTKGHDYIKDLL